MNVVTQQEAKQKVVRGEEFHSYVWSYYGEAAAVCEGPQVFLVDMPEEGSTIKVHFHDIDQYQVIVRGRGRLNNRPAEPIVFHYADAYTPYGPIIGDDGGISFFTIRSACASGFYEMPGSRHLMPGRPRRNLSGKFEIGKPVPATGSFGRETLLTQDDGVLVVGLRMEPQAEVSGEPTDAGDQYYLVCTGALMQENREVPPLGLIRVSAEEPQPMLKAGPQGAEVLLTQLPRATSRPGSDVQELAKRKIEYKLPDGVAFE